MKQKVEPIRIAHVIGKWVGGGVEAVVMNYYRHIDKNKIQFDFIIDEDSNGIPKEEIESMGGKVILIPPYQKVIKYHKELKKVLKDGKYRIVHSHINTLSVFSLFAAKCAGIPVRIAHSHSTTNKQEKKKNLMKQVLRHFSRVFATNYFACSELAGKWLFGNKTFTDGKICILNNAIEVENYIYNEELRRKKRKELNIQDNQIVIGHIGRFVKQKNHSFLIDIFNEIHKKYKQMVLVLVGQGPLEQEIKDKVKVLELEECVKFLGQRDDVNELYQAIDILAFPSLYEGLGMVLIEAQASGMYCIASTQVPDNAKISNQLDFISLNEPEKWINAILNKQNQLSRTNLIEEVRKCGYDIKIETKKLEKIYCGVDRYE